MQRQPITTDDEESPLMPKPTQQVAKLKEGTVLDHLRAGAGLRCLRVLKLPPGTTVLVGINLTSKSHGRKDLIKIERYELSEAEAAKVALISPDATISIIRDYKVVGKHGLHPPIAFRGLLKCTNPACIVHTERIPGSFVVENRDPLTVRCDYCERSIPAEQFEFA
ncbi:MAG TPA: aspartate carbamoyltransferase regulatory subunit [Planctomycetota bacterium]|nr:aspartate carbamoyltransferase regulatory subunit [Planctomycetota bacterium]